MIISKWRFEFNIDLWIQIKLYKNKLSAWLQVKDYLICSQFKILLSLWFQSTISMSFCGLSSISAFFIMSHILLLGVSSNIPILSPKTSTEWKIQRNSCLWESALFSLLFCILLYGCGKLTHICHTMAIGRGDKTSLDCLNYWSKLLSICLSLIFGSMLLIISCILIGLWNTSMLFIM